MTDTVRHEPEQSRYVFERDGERLGLTNYRVTGSGVHITHTEIDPSLRGQGLGGIMVRGVLDDLRSRTEDRVVPICPFVDRWIDLHPDYQDLLTR
ncbi:GNAT family N-acetyltransferase [Naasia sp. SYSU D00057]|uniref:GNAT family N-acetyltransferase n=1 Tax=Naasia sp. SYSU D00057 TaxID=2817380 RepID=UPI001B306F31|nr:GNAT family N-acetyltransferase [Naasia sp. SYSU D00057]